MTSLSLTRSVAAAFVIALGIGAFASRGLAQSAPNALVRIECKSSGWSFEWEGSELTPGKSGIPAQFRIHLKHGKVGAPYNLENNSSPLNTGRQVLELSAEHLLSPIDTQISLTPNENPNLNIFRFVRTPRIGHGKAISDKLEIGIWKDGTLSLRGYFATQLTVDGLVELDFTSKDCSHKKIDQMKPIGVPSPTPPKVEIRGWKSYGSGFFARLPGGTKTYLVTDSHVLKGRLPVSVQVESPRGWVHVEIPVRSTWFDFPDQDVAFIEVAAEQVQRHSLHPFELNDFQFPSHTLYAFSYAGQFGPVRPVSRGK